MEVKTGAEHLRPPTDAEEFLRPPFRLACQAVVDEPGAHVEFGAVRRRLRIVVPELEEHESPIDPKVVVAALAALKQTGDTAQAHLDDTAKTIADLIGVPEPIEKITLTRKGSDLGSVTRAVQKKIDGLKNLPPGTRISIQGESQAMQQSFSSMGSGLLLAIVLVYLLMATNFQSWLDPLIIMMAVPGALAGVLWMLVITRTTLNVESMMGAIMAVGVGVANGNLLITFANDLREQGHDAISAAIQAGATRMRPVFAAATARAHNSAAIPKGTILTVAIISPVTTALNAGSVANVIASSTRLMLSTASRSTTSISAPSARSTRTPSPLSLR